MIILEENHEGYIVYLSDETIVVRYGQGEDEFECEYDKKQLLGENVKRGDKIRATITLEHIPHTPRKLEEFLSPEIIKVLDEEWKNSLKADDLKG